MIPPENSASVMSSGSMSRLPSKSSSNGTALGDRFETRRYQRSWGIPAEMGDIWGFMGILPRIIEFFMSFTA